MILSGKIVSLAQTIVSRSFTCPRYYLLFVSIKLFFALLIL